MERNEDKALFGRNLRDARSRAGLTQQQLADAAGVDRATISQIENGRENPRADTVLTLAEVLGVRPADLWRDTPHVSGPVSARMRAGSGETGRHYEALEQHALHPGLETLLGDEKTRSLMRITPEEEEMLRSIRTRQNLPLDKEFFVDVLLAYRRSHGR